MRGLRGESMNPMTFGNMTHPNDALRREIEYVCCLPTYISISQQRASLDHRSMTPHVNHMV